MSSLHTTMSEAGILDPKEEAETQHLNRCA